MKKQVAFSFGDDSVAKAYDSILVPALFDPWAKQLLKGNGPWVNNIVLDLACGTGVVTKVLVKAVSAKGKVYALDMNPQMLNLAKQKCKEWEHIIDFIVGSADTIAIADNTLDRVICQQGFQFFPNKKLAAQEIYRVLKPKGKAIIATWCPVSECELFGVICEALEALQLFDLSQMMRVPFDILSQEELLESFSNIGFSKIDICKQKQDLFLPGGIRGGVSFAYATPIGPKLIALSNTQQNEFKELFLEKLQKIVSPSGSLGQMVSYVLKAEK